MSSQAALVLRYPIGSVWYLRTNPGVDKDGLLRLEIERDDAGRLVAVATKDRNLRYDVDAWCPEFWGEEEVK